MDFLSHLTTESATFRAALAGTDPTARVPTCPDWNASDLLWHLAEVQYFWGTIVDRRLTDLSGYTPPDRPEDGLFDFFDEAHELLAGSLRDATDDTTVWTWAASAPHVGFVRRRQAHEALIHRLDAELTAGTRTPLDPELASDGVDEALEHMFGGLPEWGTWDDMGPVGRLAATDTGREWLLQVGTWSGISPDTGTTYAGEPGAEVVTTGDVACSIEGAAADLDAWFWSRPTAGTLARSGDTTGLDRLVAAGVP